MHCADNVAESYQMDQEMCELHHSPFKMANVIALGMEETLKHTTSSSMENSSVLFEKAIPVRVKSQAEDRQAELTIRIIMGRSKYLRSIKVLQVHITDELDPFFFYSLEVNEDDFQSLKVEQCILVDFSTFPHKFIELLEHCVKSGSDDHLRFLAVLNIRTGDSTFCVVETNQFKHLSHLSLCFRQGNDSTIKTYLAGRLGEYKGANADLHEKLRKTLECLENSLQEMDNLKNQISSFKEMHSRALTEIKAKHTMDLALVKEKAMQECIEMKEKLDTDRADMEYRLRQRADAQENHVSELDKQLRELQSMRHDLEMRAAELRTKLEAAEKDLEERHQDCSAFRTRNTSLDRKLQECSKQLNQHLIRLAALEQEVQDKNDLISNMSKRLESESSHRAALEISLKDAQTAAERAEEKASASIAEANRCNQSIERLQGELRACKAKVKLKAQVVAQQDTLLHERQTTIEKNIAENSSLRQDIAALKSDNDSFRKKADESKEKLDEMQELVRSNQQMIQWLNQQLTDSQLGKFGFSSRYNFKSSENGTRGFGSHALSSLAGNLSSASLKNALPSASYSQSAHISSSTPSSLSTTHSKYSTRGAASDSSPLSPNGISKVIFKPPQVCNSSGGTPTPGASSQTSVSMFKTDDIDSNQRTFTVELKRSHMPKPQLSFAESKAYTPKSMVIGFGKAGRTDDGEGFSSRSSPVSTSVHATLIKEEEMAEEQVEDELEEELRAGLTVEQEAMVSALGKKLMKAHSTEEYKQLLKNLASLLFLVDQSPPDTTREAMANCIHAISFRQLLYHPDPALRLSLTICFCEAMFQLTLEVLGDLKPNSCPSFASRVHILESLARFKWSVLMLDLKLDILMFKGFFSTAREDHPPKVFKAMRSIMVHIVKMSSNVSHGLVDVIMFHLLKEKQNVSVAAYNLAVEIIRACKFKLQLCGQFLAFVMQKWQTMERNIQNDFYNIMFEIYINAPQMLVQLIPSLTQLLQVETAEWRLKFATLLGRLFILPGECIVKKFWICFSRFLERFTDNCLEIHTVVMECVKQLFLANPSGLESVYVLATLECGLADYNARSRILAITAICNLACSNLDWVPTKLMSKVTIHLQDSEVAVRRATLEKLTEVYATYCIKSPRETFPQTFQWMPSRISNPYDALPSDSRMEQAILNYSGGSFTSIGSSTLARYASRVLRRVLKDARMSMFCEILEGLQDDEQRPALSWLQGAMSVHTSPEAEAVKILTVDIFRKNNITAKEKTAPENKKHTYINEFVPDYLSSTESIENKKPIVQKTFVRRKHTKSRESAQMRVFVRRKRKVASLVMLGHVKDEVQEDVADAVKGNNGNKGGSHSERILRSKYKNMILTPKANRSYRSGPSLYRESSKTRIRRREIVKPQEVSSIGVTTRIRSMLLQNKNKTAPEETIALAKLKVDQSAAKRDYKNEVQVGKGVTCKAEEMRAARKRKHQAVEAPIKERPRRSRAKYVESCSSI